MVDEAWILAVDNGGATVNFFHWLLKSADTLNIKNYITYCSRCVNQKN